jgi:8-oxo-dGTP diphosphatase
VIEVLLVHRPKYDDWSLPKGKRDPAETDEQCAVREVEEETGLRCHLGNELLATAYPDARGRAKIVRYWSMSVVSERPFVPGDEIDDLRWVSVVDAAVLLSYDRDVEVMRSFTAVE